ncbi:MAG: gfo/Idh/MocA family oxidoreductase [Planctomycetota bacterium]|nr:MAG: gfo/Idh/MocA family oxidoreductase [Planctomycetota bacterium]
MSERRWTRRTLLGAGAASTAYFVSARVLGLDGAGPPSDTVRIGVIGCGGRARMIREAADVKGFRVVAVCDCFADRAANFAKELSDGQPWGVYTDFRQVIEREQLDGVMIETTTHARAWIAMHAMQMGMDVYLEKPMSLTIAEGRALVQAARKYGRVTQVGTQQRSMPLNNWASDLVRQGALGRITTVLAPNFVGPFAWAPPEQTGPPAPAEAAWDAWTNQAPLRPRCDQLQYGWARWSDYDGGGLCFGVTGWGTHAYDQVNRALGADETGPTSILLEEPVAERETGRFASQDSVGSAGLVAAEDTGAAYHRMAQLRGPRARVRMWFADGTELRLHLDGDRGPGLGAIFIGEQGKLEINRDKVASNPPELVRSPDNPGSNRRPETSYHIENWLDCIKSRQRCTADVEIGQRSSSLCHLVNIVRQVGLVGQRLSWDPAAERFTDCDEANALLSRPRRSGYELPAIG